RRHLPQGVVGDHPARPVRDDRHPRRDHDGPGDGGRAQPAPAGRSPVGAPLPPAAAPRKARLRVSPATPVLSVDELEVWFEVPGGELHAVQGVGFDLYPGERMGLVGESGCGKTTTILALMGLLPPNASVAGEVRLAGKNILAGGEHSVRPHRWTDMAMVFQGAMNAFNPVRTVLS